jgi:hypothetical protein
MFLYAVLLCYPIWLVVRSFQNWWMPDVAGIDLDWLDFSDESPDGLTSVQKVVGFCLWVIGLPLMIAGKLFFG